MANSKTKHKTKHRPSRKNLERLVKEYSNQCFWCKRTIVILKNLENVVKITSKTVTYVFEGQEVTSCIATVDHVLPMVEGGRNKLNNLVPACVACNGTRNDIYQRRKKTYNNMTHGHIAIEYRDGSKINLITWHDGHKEEILYDLILIPLVLFLWSKNTWQRYVKNDVVIGPENGPIFMRVFMDNKHKYTSLEDVKCAWEAACFLEMNEEILSSWISSLHFNRWYVSKEYNKSPELFLSIVEDELVIKSGAYWQNDDFATKVQKGFDKLSEYIHWSKLQNYVKRFKNSVKIDIHGLIQEFIFQEIQQLG